MTTFTKKICIVDFRRIEIKNELAFVFVVVVVINS